MTLDLQIFSIWYNKKCVKYFTIQKMHASIRTNTTTVTKIMNWKKNSVKCFRFIWWITLQPSKIQILPLQSTFKGNHSQVKKKYHSFPYFGATFLSFLYFRHPKIVLHGWWNSCLTQQIPSTFIIVDKFDKLWAVDIYAVDICPIFSCHSKSAIIGILSTHEPATVCGLKVSRHGDTHV